MSNSLTHWLELLERRHPQSIDLGLERCGRVYRALGSPRPGKTVITVAGTNGKGSLVAWSSSLLQAQGLSVSAYTSPHIFRFNERLALQGRPALDAQWVAAFQAVEEVRGNVSLTYFEFTTLAALLISSQYQPEVAILEVGLGGRLDTVNLVDADIAVIMPIGLDHQAFLGDDRESIGSEKAGVLRREQRVVLAEFDPPDSVLEQVNNLNCKVRRAGREYSWNVEDDCVKYKMMDKDHSVSLIPLAGEHQYANLGAALAAVSWITPDVLDHPNRVEEGIKSVQLRGRLERHQKDRRVLLDVGHNAHAAEVIAGHLVSRNSRRCLAVVGMLKDKPAELVAGVLAAHVDEWFCASLPGDRGQDGQTLARRIQAAIPAAVVLDFGSVASALEAARLTAEGTDLVLVFGSFETVSRAAVVLDQLPSADG